jgi:hypothetical protein
MVGTVAGKSSEFILDQREHFPITSEGQAKSAIRRLGQMIYPPAWFAGSIDDLQKMVFMAVATRYPTIQIPFETKLEQAMANLTVRKVTAVEAGTIKNPDETKTLVPGVPRPSLKATSAEEFAALASESVEVQQAIGKSLVELLAEQKARLDEAAKLAKRLEGKGLTGEEFKALYVFLQEDILRQLMNKSCHAADSTRVSAMKLLARKARKS